VRRLGVGVLGNLSVNLRLRREADRAMPEKAKDRSRETHFEIGEVARGCLNCAGTLIGILKNDRGDRELVVPMGDHFPSEIGGRGIDGFCSNGLDLPGFERGG